MPRALALAVVLIGLLFAGPFAYVIWRNIELGTDLGSVIWDADTLHPLRRSLWLAVTVAASSAFVGTALAWLTIRTDLPGRRVWRVLAPLPLVFPSFVGARRLCRNAVVNDLWIPFWHRFFYFFSKRAKV